MPDDSDATVSRRLRLLGGWWLLVDGAPVAMGGREQRLTALLALTGQRARAQVAGILWPDSTDARALASLRRAVLEAQRRSPGLLLVDRTSIALAPDVVVDIDDLRAAVSRAGTEADPGLLAALVGEELLPGWYDEWVTPERERLQQQRVRALEQVARQALARGEHALAVEAAHAAVAIEPLLESASELAIRAHVARGDRGGAVRELDRYRVVVKDELGVVPSPALEALVGSVPARVAPAPVPAGPPAEQTTLPPAAPVRVPRQRSVPVANVVEPDLAPPLPRPEPPESPTPVVRGVVVRLAVGAALVLAASLAVAGVGPESGGGARTPSDLAIEGPAAADVPEDVRRVVVRTGRAADGAAAFVVKATRLPARVRLEVVGPEGLNLVRSVVVRGRDGRRLVVDGLEAGTYAWTATSPSADPVVGQVRVAQPPTRVATAGDQEDRGPTPSAESAPTSPAPVSPTPVSVVATPTPAPTSTPTPTQHPSPTHQPSATSPPSPTSEPTDPGTTDPDPVG